MARRRGGSEHLEEPLRFEDDEHEAQNEQGLAVVFDDVGGQKERSKQDHQAGPGGAGASLTGRRGCSPVKLGAGAGASSTRYGSPASRMAMRNFQLGVRSRSWSTDEVGSSAGLTFELYVGARTLAGDA